MRSSANAAALLLVATLGCSAGGGHAVKPPNWPDLTVLSNYPNPHGDTCSEDGSTASGNLPRGNKLEENHLKNRFLIPARYIAYSVNDMLQLPTDGDSGLENQGANLTGFVRDVKPGGVAESCNCDARETAELDAHIEVVADPSIHDPSNKEVIIVEVTERSRRLAAAGLLSSTFGKDWSTAELERQLKGHWARISGWLFYDPDHAEESWSVDPGDSIGRRNWRGSPWEVHPVMGIEILPGKPGP